MRGLKGILGGAAAFSLVLSLAGPIVAFAATSPTLVGSTGYSVLAGSTVTNTGSTTATGAVGVSPGTAITGFLPGIATGGLQSNNTSAIAAQADNLAAFGTLNQSCDYTYGAIDLTSLSPLAPGVYCSTSSFSLSGNLNLTGSGVWVFKTVSTLITSSGSSVTGGDPCNVWWRVGSSATLNTTTSFIGNILALTDINIYTGATLNGRAMAQTGQVVLQGNTITGPTCTAAAVGGGRNGSINVVKKVINDNGGTKTIADFPLFINGTAITSGITNIFRAPDSFVVTESGNTNYTQSFSGDCDSTGHLTLSQGDAKFCIITNDDIGAPVTPPVPPIIDVLKVPSPLSLPNGPGVVAYAYTVRNIGTVPITDLTMVGDTCSPIVLITGDTNNDSKLDLNETWTYRCSTTLTETHTNTVVATGWANGLSATDIASATVVVGAPIVPPLIHVTKVPKPLALLSKGGLVTYTEKITNPGTEALSNVTLTDDKCSPMKYISGDTNNNSKLETTETWVYTCSANLTATTTNTAVATGQANGLTARDFAIVTVVVSTIQITVAVPALPDTGVAPIANVLLWSITGVGLLLIISVVLVIALKKRQI